ncbi:MAG: hypothetical protein JST32_07110 [Bacteroidetes bacterium]|nr:hypothetical protein [Bacteroidota bacterium]
MIDSFIKSNSKTEKYKLLSRIYPYNSLFATIISGSKSNYDHDDQGYIELDKTMEPHKRELFKQGKIIPGRVSLLDDLLTKLSKRKINTTLVISPAHYLFANNDTSVKIFKNLTRRFKNITFINYENDPRFSGDSLYQDAYHLNNSGAIKFSKDLADKLAADHH